jgi:hypothetical protein
MNYELAKELKAAGFPLKQIYAGAPVTAGQNTISIGDIEYEIPTLPELIEACPKQMGAATFVLSSSKQGREWVACYFDFGTNRGAELNETGKTPEEAVARLWLALNKRL